MELIRADVTAILGGDAWQSALIDVVDRSIAADDRAAFADGRTRGL